MKYRGEGWAEAFENVVIRKNMTLLPFGTKLTDPTRIKHDIFGGIIQ